MTNPGLLSSRLARLPAAPTARTVAPPSALERLIPAEATAWGPLHRVSCPAERAGMLAPSALEALSLSELPLDTSRPLFFDTETTGLAGGTGTLAFLLGVAHPSTEAEGWAVTQVHLPGPGQERPLLHWLREQLEQTTLLISFNGKSFDWPLLKSRFVMNRLAPPPERPHVDLLHCARRVFRFHLDEVRLSTLERRVLDVHRRDDIDGADIPSAWFDFLRSARVATLGRVLTHNERDVRSMISLAHRLCAAWEEQHPVIPETALGLAVLAARRGDDDRAFRFLDRATSGTVASSAWSLRAELHRRQGRATEAIDALLQALPGARDTAASLHLRLAKLYEHRLRDFEAAHRHAALAAPLEGPTRHLARRTRLEERLARLTSTT